jgi:hypothetical protein
MSPAQRNGRTSSCMPHEGHLASNRQLGRGGPVRLDEVGLPSDDNELEARVVELAQRLKERGKPLRPKCPSAAKTMSASSRPRLERTARRSNRRSKPSDRRILSRSTALGMTSTLAAVVGYSSSSSRASPCRERRCGGCGRTPRARPWRGGDGRASEASLARSCAWPSPSAGTRRSRSGCTTGRPTPGCSRPLGPGRRNSLAIRAGAGS